MTDTVSINLACTNGRFPDTIEVKPIGFYRSEVYEFKLGRQSYILKVYVQMQNPTIE